MDVNKYKTPYDVGPEPRRPVAPDPETATPGDYHKHACLLEKYRTDKEDFDRRYNEYQRKSSELLAQFRDDALAECGLAEHPKRDRAYAFAWERGHSNGLANVFYWLQEAAELLRD